MEKKGDNKSKINVYLHAVATLLGLKNYRGDFYTTVSVLYKIEMDPDKYENPTNLPPILHPKDRNLELDLPLIKPVYIFNNNKDMFYPSGMSFVNLGSKLYFMGGSLSYKAHLLGLSSYDNDLGDYKYVSQNMPVCNAFEDHLDCFPPDVYVFDCITSELLPVGIPPMNTGKPENPITFVVDDQIFVLSSRNGPKGMTHFEKFNPVLNKWKNLKPPPEKDFFSKWKIACGSAVMGRKLFVTFRSDFGDSDVLWDNIDMLWYDIDTDYWTCCKSPYIPKIYRDSVFVGNTIYSTVSEPDDHTFDPVLSVDGFDSTNYVKGIAQSKLLKKHHDICPYDIVNWPICYNGYGYSTRFLFHLGGFLNGTDKNSRCLGLVELFKPYGGGSEYGVEYETQSELCFVVFEALEGNTSGGSFNVRTIHSCHFSTDMINMCFLNCARVYSS